MEMFETTNQLSAFLVLEMTIKPDKETQIFSLNLYGEIKDFEKKMLLILNSILNRTVFYK